MALQRQRGLTLVELIITVVIAAILMTVAGPALTTITGAARAKSHIDSLYQDLSYARQLAATYQNRVTVCHLSSSNVCDGDWKKGYTVFIDAGTINNFDGGGVDEELRVKEAFPDQDFIKATENQFSFGPDGMTSFDDDEIITYCPLSADSEDAKSLSVGPSGQTRYKDELQSCS